MELVFFPTSEGFFDYENKRYIYQYKDHLGNVRLSYTKNPATGLAKVLNGNHYYPFGMNHLNQEGTVYDPLSVPYNYKYNGKELQETGAYDYGWRQYMPDIGRWNGLDQLSESYASTSPYAYVLNNPAMMFDPDGRVSMDWINSFWNNSQNGVNTTWTNTGSGFSNNWGGNMDYDATPTNFYFGGTSTGIGGSYSGNYAGTINLPTVYLSGKSSGWGSQIQSQFNSFMNDAWNGRLPRNETIDGIINNRYYDLGSLGLDQAVAKTGSYLTKALDTKSTVNFTILNQYAKPALRTNVAGSLRETSKVANVAKGLKVAGNVLAGVGVGVSVYQVTTGQISKTEFAVDMAFTAIGFAGPAGAAVSLLYFGGKALYEYQTGDTLFEAP